MKAIDLIAWRRARRKSQAQLAELLGVARCTVNRWENEQATIPHNIKRTLDNLQVEKEPLILTPKTAKRWPHLHIYERRNGFWVAGYDHPRYVLRLGDGKIDANVLDTEAYRVAREAQNGK